MVNMLKRLRCDTKGASVIEYALIAGFISLTVMSLSDVLSELLDSILNSINIEQASPGKNPSGD